MFGNYYLISSVVSDAILTKVIVISNLSSKPRKS